MSRKNEPDPDWLRPTLRAGDPAEDGHEPVGPELARMRRRVLSAVVAPVRSGMPARALATAAVVVVTVLLGWSVWNDAVGPRPTATFKTAIHIDSSRQPAAIKHRLHAVPPDEPSGPTR